MKRQWYQTVINKIVQRCVRSRAGMTLTEMLASIAMLAILAGLLIPVSASMYRRFRLTEMDDFARQICVAAQNEQPDKSGFRGFSYEKYDRIRRLARG